MLAHGVTPKACQGKPHGARGIASENGEQAAVRGAMRKGQVEGEEDQ